MAIPLHIRERSWRASPVMSTLPLVDLSPRPKYQKEVYTPNETQYPRMDRFIKLLASNAFVPETNNLH